MVILLIETFKKQQFRFLKNDQIKLVKSSKYSDENELKLRREIRFKPIINEKKKKKRVIVWRKLGGKEKKMEWMRR